MQPASHGPRHIVAPGSEMRHNIGHLPPVTGAGTVPGIKDKAVIVGEPLNLRVQDVRADVSIESMGFSLMIRFGV